MFIIFVFEDDVLILLAKEGFPQLLINLIEKNKHEVKDEDTRSVLKMACDLVVIILTKGNCLCSWLLSLLLHLYFRLLYGSLV